MTTQVKRTANIHEAPTGLWYITDNALDYLCEFGSCWKSERSAIKAARDSGYWTHRVNRDGRIVKL